MPNIDVLLLELWDEMEMTDEMENVSAEETS